MKRGDSWLLKYKFDSGVDTTTVLTGTGKMQIRENATDLLAYTYDLVAGDKVMVDGYLVITVPATATVDFGYGTYKSDVEFVHTGGVTSTQTLSITVDRDITHL